MWKFKPSDFSLSGKGCDQNKKTKPKTMVSSYRRALQIIPSVLPADFGNLGAAVKKMEISGCHRIQFDVMDGNFVPNVTFGPDTIRHCRKYTNLPFEVQLMISETCLDSMLTEFVEVAMGANKEPGGE